MNGPQEFSQPRADDHPASRPEPSRVPVYNCHVYLAKKDEGIFVVRVSTLNGITGSGKTEREALQKAVAAFKTVVAGHHARGEPIPWLEPPLQPEPGEQPRWIAVHL